MTAATTQPAWLDELVDLYGPARHLRPVRAGRTVTDSWLWPDASVNLQVQESDDPYERTCHVRVCNGRRQVDVRADGSVCDVEVRLALELARLLPCPDCRGLKEVPGDRDETGEQWHRCGCTDPSVRPRTGVAVTS